jgi:hypothetical protein
MHGMLSAAVILAAFAVIALLSGASAVWIFRAAGVAPRRSRSARMTGMPGAGTGPAPDAPGEPDKDTGRNTDRETGGTDAEYPERSRLGAVLAALGQPAGTAELDGLGGPSDPAGRPATDGVYDVYDIEGWAAAEDSRGGYDRPGLSSPGPRGWPDTAKSLYSRGWPVMDSSPPRPDPQQAGNETETGAAGEPETGAAGEPETGAAGKTETGAAGETETGAVGETETGAVGETEAGAVGETETGAVGETETGATGEPDDAPQTGPPGRPEGARLYVLDESRRAGR